jgi:hypothetical protein
VLEGGALAWEAVAGGGGALDFGSWVLDFGLRVRLVLGVELGLYGRALSGLRVCDPG